MSVQLFRRWFQEVWNERRDTTIDELFAADGLAHGLPATLRGPSGVRVFRDGFVALFPEISIEVHDTLDSPPERDGTVTVVGRLTAHVARANGQRGELAFMAWSRWRGGKIVESWNVCDFLGLQKQVGDLGL